MNTSPPQHIYCCAPRKGAERPTPGTRSSPHAPDFRLLPPRVSWERTLLNRMRTWSRLRSHPTEKRAHGRHLRCPSRLCGKCHPQCLFRTKSRRLQPRLIPHWQLLREKEDYIKRFRDPEASMPHRFATPWARLCAWVWDGSRGAQRADLEYKKREELRCWVCAGLKRGGWAHKANEKEEAGQAPRGAASECALDDAGPLVRSSPRDTPGSSKNQSSTWRRRDAAPERTRWPLGIRTGGVLWALRSACKGNPAFRSATILSVAQESLAWCAVGLHGCPLSLSPDIATERSKMACSKCIKTF